jgi:class 3 adenylate cyclase
MRCNGSADANSTPRGTACSPRSTARPAIRCACRIRNEVRTLGLDVRAGRHTGECEVVGDKLAGIAVHIGARVASTAAPGEVLVSNTVKDLVAGSGLAFESRGLHTLKGGPGEWPLFAVVAAG